MSKVHKNQLTLIENGLQRALSLGIKIEADAFLYHEKGKIQGANWAGAMVFDKPENYSYRKIKEILEINDNWFYNFHIGWSQGRNLTIDIVNKNNEIIDRKNEEISLEAMILAKKYLPWR